MRWPRLLGPSWHSPRRPRSRADLVRGRHAVRMTRQNPRGGEPLCTSEPVSEGSPVTESNRRPSPYHVDSGSRFNCCDAGQARFRCRPGAGQCLRFSPCSGTRLARTDLFRVRELRRSLLLSYLIHKLLRGVRTRPLPSVAVSSDRYSVGYSARAASPPHSLHAISNRPSHMYGKAVVIAARPVQLPYGSCVRRWIRQHHAAGSRTVR